VTRRIPSLLVLVAVLAAGGRAPAAEPEPTAADIAIALAQLRGDQHELEGRLERWRGARFLRPVELAVREAPDEHVAGWYDTATRRLVVVPERSARFRRGTLLHELVHALQDQRFDLAALHARVQDDPDAAHALDALVEGEAMLAVEELMDYDFFAHAKLPARGPVDEALFEKLFDYGDGSRFVARVRERGGWAAVDALFRDPPRASVAILRPDRDPHAVPEPLGVLPVPGTPIGVGREGAYALLWRLSRDAETRSRARDLLAAFDDDLRREVRLPDGRRRLYWDLRFDDPAAAARFLAGAAPVLAADGWRERRCVGRDVRLARRQDGPAPGQGR
jgi:hypothetical protein